jgi:hypothetical protein
VPVVKSFRLTPFFLVVAMSVAAGGLLPPNRAESAGPRQTAGGEPYVVLIVLDGARPGYFQVPGIPHVQALRKGGSWFQNAFTGILESETPSGHAAISSGSEPRDDGILGFTWANAGKKVTIYDPSIVRSGFEEKLMSSAPSLAGQFHQLDPAAKVVALGSYKYYANDALGGPKADVIMYYETRPNGRFTPTFIPGHVPPQSLLDKPALSAASSHQPLGTFDHLAMKLGIATFKKMHQRVTLINLPEFDMPLGHVDGGSIDRKDLLTLMHGFDRDLAAMEAAYAKAGVLDRTLFVLTADHGMVPIRHRVSYTDIKSAVLRAGTAVIHGNYHSGAYLWVADKSRLPQAAANVAALTKKDRIQSVYYRHPDGSYQRVATAGELDPAVESANQYLLGTFTGPVGPDIVVLFDEGTVGAQSGEANWKGDHGGSDWQSQHIPLLISGPGVRSNHVSTFPARLIDIAPTVLALAGGSKGTMRGVVLTDAFRTPMAGDVAAEAALRPELGAVVTALSTESHREAGQK